MFAGDRATYDRELAERLADLFVAAVRDIEARESGCKARPADTAATDLEMAHNRAPDDALMEVQP